MTNKFKQVPVLVVTNFEDYPMNQQDTESFNKFKYKKIYREFIFAKTIIFDIRDLVRITNVEASHIDYFKIIESIIGCQLQKAPSFILNKYKIDFDKDTGLKRLSKYLFNKEIENKEDWKQLIFMYELKRTKEEYLKLRVYEYARNFLSLIDDLEKGGLKLKYRVFNMPYL